MLLGVRSICSYLFCVSLLFLSHTGILWYFLFHQNVEEKAEKAFGFDQVRLVEGPEEAVQGCVYLFV